MEQLVLLAIPIFTLLMVVEFAYGWVKNKNTYTWADTLSNLMQGLISRLSQFINQFFHIGIYTLLYHVIWGNFENPFWFNWYGVVLGLIVFDFCDYWFHRTEHESAIFWACHVVHHQSKQYNLSVALRQVSTEPILGFIFYLPLALLGMPPQQLLLTVLMVLFYQFWVHTEHIGKLGWFDWVFDSPANHRVHHAVNPQYIDKNYGGFLMIWDHLFGTYEPEVEPCVYGTKKPFESVDPVWTILSEYVSVFKAAWASAGWTNKLKVIFMPPGWSNQESMTSNESLASPSQLPSQVHSQTASNASEAAERIASSAAQHSGAQHSVVQAHSLQWSMSKKVLCLVQFFSVVGASVLFLANEDEMTYLSSLPIITSIVVMCWALGSLMAARTRAYQLLFIDAVCATVIYAQFNNYLL